MDLEYERAAERAAATLQPYPQPVLVQVLPYGATLHVRPASAPHGHETLPPGVVRPWRVVLLREL